MCSRSKVAPTEYEEKVEEKSVELEPVADDQSESSSVDSQSETSSIEESELEVVTVKSIENEEKSITEENTENTSDSEDDSESESESESVVSEQKPTNQQQENPTVLAASASGLGILLLFSFVSGVIEIIVYRNSSKSDPGLSIIFPSNGNRTFKSKTKRTSGSSSLYNSFRVGIFLNLAIFFAVRSLFLSFLENFREFCTYWPT